MSFLYPTFLFALSAIAVPILVHLFNFRKFKVVYFSNVQFLKNVQQETKAKSQLKNLLILFSRILFVFSIVFAFAQPFIPSSLNTPTTGQSVVSIYIDNSFSMDSESKTGNLLETAKNKARSILSAFPAGSKFLLITNDFEQQHQHLVNKDQFLDFLQKVQVSPAGKKLSEITSRQKDYIFQGTSKISKQTLFIISDFQKSFTDLNRLKNDSSLQTYLVPIEAQTMNNLYIDSCWFESPFRKINQQEELFVRVFNKSTENYNNIPIKVMINDSLKSLASFNIQANTSEIISLKFTNTTTGLFNGMVEISDYPVIYDNTFFFTYNILKNLEILSINGTNESPNLKALYGSDDYFILSNISEKNTQASTFANYNTIILNEVKNLSSGLTQELHTYINNGGTVIFIPAFDGNIESYNALLSQFRANTITETDTHKTKIDFINYNDAIFSNVFQKKEENADMPYLAKYFNSTEISNATNIPLFKTINKKTVLSVVTYGKGKLYITSFPLSSNANNFAKHPIFVPTFYNIVFNSNLASKLYYIIGRDNMIELGLTANPESDIVYHIIDTKNKTDFIPQYTISNSSVKIFLQNNISKAGNYNILYKNQTVASAAFNYNRSESELSYLNSAEINADLVEYNLKSFSVLDVDSKFISSEIEKISKGTQLWKIFILMALFALACEIALIRLWKS